MTEWPCSFSLHCSHFELPSSVRMLRQTCRRTSLTRCLQAFLQVTLSDRIKDAHFSRRCVSLTITDVARAAITARRVVCLHDQSCFDLKSPDDFVEADGEQTTEERSEPVDPVIAWEVVSSHSSAERACRVQRCSGEGTANQLCDEEC